MESLDILFRRTKNRLIDLKYRVKAIFAPHNVIYIQRLEPTWNDRDDLLFHGVFQVLVDFIELEQPFLNWNDQVPGRHTNYEEMAQALEVKYSPELNEPLEFHSQYYTKAYPEQKEILALYKWYKDELYETPAGSYLTWTFEQDKAHRKMCTEKMVRVVELRGYYWT